MLFNSIDFALFLPIVFVLYWSINNKYFKIQNTLLVVASYFFYGWWDWRFLFLIFFSTVVDYFVGQKLEKEQSLIKKKRYLWISIFANIGTLFVFKYNNFFIENLISGFSLFGMQLNASTLNIILPVGISFYTFQTLSYTIDIYKGKLSPTRDFVAFTAYVSFFPQLVAGPIERASNLLPQFIKSRKFDEQNAIRGLKQIIWGLFKKVVIADSCAPYVNEIFSNYEDYSSLTLLLGIFYFSFQIYCDFSGYSDIAIGTSRLFGFDLKKNFAFPYFSRDISEFWRRWHISLSTWFRDYLYIPLGGSRGTIGMKIRNTMLIFVVSGFWHGANWTFIVWGALNALYFLPLLLKQKNRIHTTSIVASGTILPTIREAMGMLTTYLLILFSWTFFRADNIHQALNYIKKISLLNFSVEKIGLERYNFEVTPFIIALLLIEWFYRKREFPFDSGKKSLVAMVIIIGVIVVFGSYSSIQNFIYFQF
ncbi:MAG: MBOAT family protein [Roseivirga sp.]